MLSSATLERNGKRKVSEGNGRLPAAFDAKFNLSVQTHKLITDRYLEDEHAIGVRVFGS